MHTFLLEMFFLFSNIAQICFAVFIFNRLEMLQIYCSAVSLAQICSCYEERSDEHQSSSFLTLLLLVAPLLVVPFATAPSGLRGFSPDPVVEERAPHSSELLHS